MPPEGRPCRHPWPRPPASWGRWPAPPGRTRATATTPGRPWVRSSWWPWAACPGPSPGDRPRSGPSPGEPAVTTSADDDAGLGQVGDATGGGAGVALAVRVDQDGGEVRPG